MSKIDIAELRRLLAEATPGPWKRRGGVRAWIAAPESVLVPSVDGADGDLIAAAVNALGPLLDELEAARKVVIKADALECKFGDAPTRSAIDAYGAVTGRGDGES